MSKAPVLACAWGWGFEDEGGGGLVEGEEEEVGSRTTTWAFCLRTSAGVRMRQETSSPVEEARAWRMGRGIRGFEGEGEGSEALRVWREVLVAS